MRLHAVRQWMGFLLDCTLHNDVTIKTLTLVGALEMSRLHQTDT